MSDHMSRATAGVETLLALAAMDAALEQQLLQHTPEQRARAAARSGVRLTPTEQAILASLRPDQLRRAIHRLRRRVTAADAGRRRFVQGAAAGLLTALASAGRADPRPKIDAAVQDYRRSVQAGGSITGSRPGPQLRLGVVQRPKDDRVLRVRQRRLEVVGMLRLPVVAAMLERRLRHLRQCHRRAMPPGDRHPVRIDLALAVAATGRVLGAEVTHLSVKNKKLERLVLLSARRWLFPQPKDSKLARIRWRVEMDWVPRSQARPRRTKPIR